MAICCPNQVVHLKMTQFHLVASSGNIDINGKVSANLIAPTTVGNATVTASAGSISQAVPVTFVAGLPTFITTHITPATLAADGKRVATVRARLSDAYGNFLAGQASNFTTSSGFISDSAQTDANGVALRR
jgi:hypothetical protein